MENKPSQPALFASGIFGFLALMIISILLVFYASPPWSQWGGALAITGTASVYFLRFISLFTAKPMQGYLPYVVATVALLVFVIVFAPITYGKPASVVFFALFYWLVWIIVSELKKGVQGFQNWRKNL